MKRAPQMIGKLVGCQLEHGITYVLHTRAVNVLLVLLCPLVVLRLHRLPIPFRLTSSLNHASRMYSLLRHSLSLPSTYNSYSRWPCLKPVALICVSVYSEKQYKYMLLVTSAKRS
jgi:hypothetical protein